MADPARRGATYQDVLAAPEHMIAEIVDGELSLMPRPRPRHAAVTSALGEELGPPFKRGRGGPGGWLILDEPELHLGADILVPDLAGWRRERLPAVPDEDAFISVSPDWVCEVLSPTTASFDKKHKMPVYAREQVEFLWLVDPALRSVDAYRLAGERYSMLCSFAGSDVARIPPFDAIELEVSALWADLAEAQGA